MTELQSRLDPQRQADIRRLLVAQATPGTVVTRNRRIALGRTSALRISLATVFRQHGTFWASSSTCTLGAPYDSRLAWWIVLIRAVRSTWRCRRALGPRCRAA